MKPRILRLLLLLLLIACGRCSAQQTPDPKQPELAVWARLKTMIHADLQETAFIIQVKCYSIRRAGACSIVGRWLSSSELTGEW